MTNQYLVVVPPISLPFHKMSRTQARIFFDWYVKEIPNRIEILTQYVHSTPGFEDWRNDRTPESLISLGVWFVAQIEKQTRNNNFISLGRGNFQYWHQLTSLQNYELTNFTISICFDIGAYLSQTIIKNNDFHWILNVTRKSDRDYQQPVIIGKGKLVFNPTELLITYAHGVCQGLKGSNGLKEIYDIWLSILQDK